MHLWVPRSYHVITVIVSGLEFYNKYTKSVVEIIKIFLFLGLSPSAGSKADLLARRWDAVLGVV